MNWNEIADKHHEWVERMGWHNKTVLESLALIASELGEAADECFDPSNKLNLGEELADIVVRVADLAKTEGIEFEKVMSLQNIGNCTQWDIEWRAETLPERIAETMVDVAKWINTARSNALDEKFEAAMSRVMRRVQAIAVQEGIDLKSNVLRKMAINEQRGTRGRRI